MVDPIMVLKWGSFMARVLAAAVAVLFTFVSVTGSSAQGVQTGALTGVVTDATGHAVANAVIRAESPVQQGVRMTTSDVAGAYRLTGLAAGDYSITIELTGLQPATSQVRIGVGMTERLNVALQPPAVVESVTVTAASPSLLSRKSGGLNFRSTEIEALPTGRTLSLVAELSPGLTNNTPNVNQVTISGAVA